MCENHYCENQKCRCFVEYDRLPGIELHMMLCGIEHCTPEKHFGPRVMPGFHLNIVLSGEGTLIVNGKEHKKLHSGQMFLIKPNETVEYFPNADHPWTFCWMTFDGEVAEAAMNEAGFTDGVYTRNCYVDMYEFFHLVELALSHLELNHAGRLWRHGVLCQFVALAIESNRRNPSNGLRGDSEQRHSRQSYIDHAVEFINNNYAMISVEDVSSYLGIHRSYLSKLFREQMGCTPNDFLLHRRMTRGAQLLIHTDLTIREIGETVGYEDPLTFSKAFKRFYAVSPKYYRNLPEDQREAMNKANSKQVED